jgi:hypothetical protein
MRAILITWGMPEKALYFKKNQRELDIELTRLYTTYRKGPPRPKLGRTQIGMSNAHPSGLKHGFSVVGILAIVYLAVVLLTDILRIAQEDPKNPPPAVERHRGE